MAKRGNAGESDKEISEKNSTKNSRSVAPDVALHSDGKNYRQYNKDLITDLDSDSPAPEKRASPKTAGTPAEGTTGSQETTEAVNRVITKTKESSKRYKDTAKEVHPAGSYCSATKHKSESSKCAPEKLRALLAQAQSRADEGLTKTIKPRQDIQPQTASSIHIAHNLDLNNLDKTQGAAIKYQASKFESFTPQIKQTEAKEQTVEKSPSAQTQMPASKTGRSFSAPEYQIHQESLEFYQAHKKAFQTADERFQKLPAEIPARQERNEGTSRAESAAHNESSERTATEPNPTRKPRIERIDPYYALNYQLAKDNSLFNPPQGDYRVKSIDKADPVKHPDALALDIPESRILTNLPTFGADRILQNAENHASGIPIRAGEIIDAVEAMMEDHSHESSEKVKNQILDENSERRLVMLLDGKHKGLLFPVKRTGEQAKHDATIASITKIFLPDGNHKFIRGEKSAGKVHLPNLKDFIAKIKSRIQGKNQAISEQVKEQDKTVWTSKDVFPQTVVSPQQTGTMVIKELKPGTPEPEPLASQLTKAQKTKQQEDIKKLDSKERPESKTGNKDAYQGRLPEIKMSYTKSQPTTKDFTKLKPSEKHPDSQTGEIKDIGKGEHATRIRDIYAKFDIQLPRKKLRPEITESGTYKIIPNQTSQKLPAVSEDKMDAPYEVASFFKEEDQFPGGDPKNPENQPFPKIATSASEEPRRSYVVKQGETIEYIAVAELQEAALAPLIREINEILLEQFYDHEKQEPASVIPAGVMLLLPNKKDIIAFRLKVARNRF